MIPKNIYPRSPIRRLRREDYADRLECAIPTDVAVAVVGLNHNFAVRAAGYGSGARPRSLKLAQVLDLLELDEYEETFVPRSLVPEYLLRTAALDAERRSGQEPIDLPTDHFMPTLLKGHAGDLIRRLEPKSVQCAVTSSPYWGMRLYDDPRVVHWADGEHCSYGFEQTPDGFIRHTIELLYLLKPALTDDGSVWWNLMDTYNTRTPIRGSSREKLQAMGDHPEYALGWTEHAACRHSAGHMYLQDGELAMIPARVAQRASRIGYRVKSFITWNKDTTPEPVKSRVNRKAEVILHLSAGTTPYFSKESWQNLDRRLGGCNPPYESVEKITDVWSLPTANGKNGHGAEFAVALPGRCISLTSKPGDLVLDPFVGAGTSALAAMELGRRCIGFDTSQTYLATARRRVKQLSARLSVQSRLLEVIIEGASRERTNSRNGSSAHTQAPEALPTDFPDSRQHRRSAAGS